MVGRVLFFWGSAFIQGFLLVLGRVRTNKIMTWLTHAYTIYIYIYYVFHTILKWLSNKKCWEHLWGQFRCLSYPTWKELCFGIIFPRSEMGMPKCQQIYYPAPCYHSPYGCFNPVGASCLFMSSVICRTWMESSYWWFRNLAPVDTVGSLSHYLQVWKKYFPGGWEWDFWTINCITKDLRNMFFFKIRLFRLRPFFLGVLFNVTFWGWSWKPSIKRWSVTRSRLEETGKNLQHTVLCKYIDIYIYWCTLPKNWPWRAPKWWALEKVTGPFKNGNFWYRCSISGVYIEIQIYVYLYIYI